MKFIWFYSIIKRSDVSPALMIMNKVLPMFKKKPQRPKYDKTNKKAVLKCSICTGEQVAGFKVLDTDHFELPLYRVCQWLWIRQRKPAYYFTKTWDLPKRTGLYASRRNCNMLQISVLQWDWKQWRIWIC